MILSSLFFFCRSTWGLSHNLLHHSDYSEVPSINLHWLTWGLTGNLLSMVSWRLMGATDAVVLPCGEQQRTIDWVLCMWRRMFSLMIPGLPLACSLCVATPVWCGRSLCNLTSASILLPSSRNCSWLEHSLRASFSGHSRWRWTPSHHRQRGGCLQSTQIWPKRWQL
jgi:hypothetical protein